MTLARPSSGTARSGIVTTMVAVVGDRLTRPLAAVGEAGVSSMEARRELARISHQLRGAPPELRLHSAFASLANTASRRKAWGLSGLGRPLVLALLAPCLPLSACHTSDSELDREPVDAGLNAAAERPDGGRSHGRDPRRPTSPRPGDGRDRQGPSPPQEEAHAGDSGTPPGPPPDNRPMDGRTISGMRVQENRIRMGRLWSIAPDGASAPLPSRSCPRREPSLQRLQSLPAGVRASVWGKATYALRPQHLTEAESS